MFEADVGGRDTSSDQLDDDRRTAFSRVSADLADERVPTVLRPLPHKSSRSWPELRCRHDAATLVVVGVEADAELAYM